jgi:hypothetical protein
LSDQFTSDGNEPTAEALAARVARLEAALDGHAQAASGLFADLVATIAELLTVVADQEAELAVVARRLALEPDALAEAATAIRNEARQARLQSDTVIRRADATVNRSRELQAEMSERRRRA